MDYTYSVSIDSYPSNIMTVDGLSFTIDPSIDKYYSDSSVVGNYVIIVNFNAVPYTESTGSFFGATAISLEDFEQLHYMYITVL